MFSHLAEVLRRHLLVEVGIEAAVEEQGLAAGVHGRAGQKADGPVRVGRHFGSVLVCAQGKRRAEEVKSIHSIFFGTQRPAWFKRNGTEDVPGPCHRVDYECISRRARRTHLYLAHPLAALAAACILARMLCMLIPRGYCMLDTPVLGLCDVQAYVSQIERRSARFVLSWDEVKGVRLRVVS